MNVDGHRIFNEDSKIRYNKNDQFGKKVAHDFFTFMRCYSTILNDSYFRKKRFGINFDLIIIPTYDLFGFNVAKRPVPVESTRICKWFGKNIPFNSIPIWIDRFNSKCGASEIIVHVSQNGKMCTLGWMNNLRLAIRDEDYEIKSTKQGEKFYTFSLKYFYIFEKLNNKWINITKEYKGK